MQIFAILNKRILFHPFFLSCSFLVIYREKKNARKTRIDPLVSVFRARDKLIELGVSGIPLHTHHESPSMLTFMRMVTGKQPNEKVPRPSVYKGGQFMPGGRRAPKGGCVL